MNKLERNERISHGLSEGAEAARLGKSGLIREEQSSLLLEEVRASKLGEWWQ